MTTGSDDANAAPPIVVRVPAVSRVAGDDRVVCAVGWDTDVHTLSGAARIVWETAMTPGSPDDLASRIGVPADDPLLRDALTLLTAAGLLVEGDRS